MLNLYTHTYSAWQYAFKTNTYRAVKLRCKFSAVAEPLFDSLHMETAGGKLQMQVFFASPNPSFSLPLFFYLLAKQIEEKFLYLLGNEIFHLSVYLIHGHRGRWEF